MSHESAFVVQTVNYDRVYKHNVTKLPLIERPENGVVFDRSYEMLDEGRIKFLGKLQIPDGTVSESSTTLLGIRLNMLKRSPYRSWL